MIFLLIVYLIYKMAKFLASLNGKEEDISIDVSLGHLKLLTSGVLFTTNGKPISINFDDVTLNFHFEENKSSNELSFETRKITDKEMDFVLINFNSPFGQGKIEPINLIFTDEFDLHLSFFVHKIDKHKLNYQLTYSILYGEKND